MYSFKLTEDIGPATWRTTQLAFDEAKANGAKLIVIEMNTYGGMVNFADSIRTKILNSPVKTAIFINHNAASAGALIALACDDIYMSRGSSIGAASVVNGEGEVLPEKYQSYMRGLMRATAEAKNRDPKIAEAFVDPDVDLPKWKEKGKVLTLTSKEAIEAGLAKAYAKDVYDVIQQSGLADSDVAFYKSTWVDALINFLVNPAVSSILILLIIGGIYFEMQTPGIGFALVVAIIAALLFFAPLYMQGLADNWEIVLFVLGVVLLLLEIFVIPGFGIAGILGIVFVICGLTFSMVPNDWFDFVPSTPNNLFNSLIIVLISMVGSIVLCVVFGKGILHSKAFQRLVLTDEQQSSMGYVSALRNAELIGREGEVKTTLRPSGKIEIDGKWYDAVAREGFVERGETVVVEKQENYNLVVRKKQ
ncbi:NfeD family protein [Olivibacter sitiensis]|uniref:NfeD family protein n=1 Tax=Olivibacter sitiensis TaxID=376470 RepID=UPI001FE0D318|nr:NfeD family protein [Olivibacter sitiensis]